MKNDQLEIGKIANTHGIRGEVKVITWTDDSAQYEEFEWVYVRKNNNLEKLYIDDLKYQNNNVIIKFKGVNSLEEAEIYKNLVLVMDRDVLGEPTEGNYYICDLLGLLVQNDQGEKLGMLDDIIHTGSNDVYIVKNELGKELLVPALKEVIFNVDLDKNIMTVKLPEGLIE